jgi:hypothetical protein
LLRDYYESLYGLFDHETESHGRPLALVAMHWGENGSDGSQLDERIEQFVDLDVGKYFHISFSEFMDLPSDICRRMLEKAKRRKDEEGKVAKNADDLLKEATR